MYIKNMYTKSGRTSVGDVCMCCEDLRGQRMCPCLPINSKPEGVDDVFRHTPFLHPDLHYYQRPPRGALNLWSFVWHVAFLHHSSSFFALSVWFLSRTKLTNAYILWSESGTMKEETRTTTHVSSLPCLFWILQESLMKAKEDEMRL